MSAHQATSNVRLEAFERWRDERERDLSAPHGWLSLTALHWLDATPRSFHEVPGRWSANGHGAHVTATAADGLALDGSPINGAVTLEPVDGAPGVLVETGERRIEVIRRSEHLALRVRDPRAPARLGFTGVPRFDWDARWIVPATFEPLPAPQELTVGAVVEGLTHTARAVGLVRFELQGQSHVLLAFAGHDGALVLQFRDATTGVTTHGSSRAVTIDPPDGDGRVTVDLNRVVNLPCAFTDHATCPLAPAENAVKIAIEAGERTPR